MHIPDGFLTNAINLTTAGIPGLTLSLALKKAKQELSEKEIPLVGVTAAFIFAAQMINFPVAGGTSGHFLGAALASILLGPWLSFIIMSLVLVLQCLGFADGGLTALGSNIVNMGLIGGMGSYLMFRFFQFLFPRNRRGFLLASALSPGFRWSWPLSLAPLSWAFSGTSPFALVIPSSDGLSIALIGIGER